MRLLESQRAFLCNVVRVLGPKDDVIVVGIVVVAVAAIDAFQQGMLG
jgi:hypothetical protein